MPLTTLTRIKQYLGVSLTDTSQDAWHAALQAGAERAILNRIRRDIESQDYVQYYSGTGTQYLPLRQRPVTAISAVYLNNSGYYGSSSDPFPSTTLLTYGSDYTVDWDTNGSHSESGLLIRLTTVWPETYRSTVPRTLATSPGPPFGNIKVLYTAGYDPIPEDLQLAVATTVSLLKRTVPYGGAVESERIGDYSYTMFNSFLSRHRVYPEWGSVEETLNKYREHPI